MNKISPSIARKRWGKFRCDVTIKIHEIINIAELYSDPKDKRFILKIISNNIKSNNNRLYNLFLV
jgi:glutathionylspermidine synthase